MSDSLKDRLKTDLQSIKAKGATRTTRIRDIIQTAATQSIAELKEGFGEVRSTANQTFSTAAESFNATQSTTEPSPSTVDGIRIRVVQQVRERLVNLDAKLTTQYGDRYAPLKQRLEQFRAWYATTKAKAEANGVDPVQQKQSAIASKVAEQGAVVARTEQQIKQRLIAAIVKR